jgi:hypothetical protein
MAPEHVATARRMGGAQRIRAALVEHGATWAVRDLVDRFATIDP